METSYSVVRKKGSQRVGRVGDKGEEAHRWSEDAS